VNADQDSGDASTGQRGVVIFRTFSDPGNGRSTRRKRHAARDKARTPERPKCVVNDLCLFKGKTTLG
jgi:hypothetical protein